jgi:hypothetical protein
MVHACETANEAKKDIAIRRASGFNELHEAALKKECEAESGSGSGVLHNQQSSSGLSGKGKEKQQFGPEVDGLKKLVKKLVMEGGALKWTWGVDLIEDDLCCLIQGADCQNQVPHSEYNQDLPSDSIQSKTSEVLDPINLEDPNDPELCFDELSRSITIIPKLRPHHIQPFYWHHPEMSLTTPSLIR